MQKVSFDIDEEDNTKLDQIAEKQGRTKANLLRVIVKEYLD